MGTDDAQYRSSIHDCAAGLVLRQGEVLEFVEAAKKSRKRRAARSPASAIIAGTASALRSVAVVRGAVVSATAGTLRLSPLMPTPYNE